MRSRRKAIKLKLCGARHVGRRMMICRGSGGFVSQQNADAARSGGGDGPGADGSNDSTSNCAALARTGKGGGRRRVKLVVVLNGGVDVAEGRMY